MRALSLIFICLCAPAGAFAASPLEDLLSADLRAFAEQDGGKPAVPLSGGPGQPMGTIQPAKDAAPGVSAAGFISLWSQDCSAGQCALPQGLMPARKVAFEMVLPNGPGQAQRKEVVENFTVEGFGELKVRLVFYAICPYGALPKETTIGRAEGCPSRYFQVQAELSGAAAAFCAASLNAGDFLPFPVFMCAASPEPGKRLGVTLHRI
ncbi:MAG: hypothetical protein WCK76_14340 [Elusimicrobiota bacterium]